MSYYQIKEFFGIQQQTDSALLPVTSASDARNMDTSDGNLSVAKGYEKHISAAIPDTGRILKVIVARGAVEKFYIVAANAVYTFKDGAWATVYTFATELTTSQVDYIQTQIGTDDYLIIGTGETQMVKIKISDDTATLFGTGATSFSGTVSAVADNVITLNETLSAEAVRHAPLDGITIDGNWFDVASANGNTVTLAETPSTAPTVGSTASIRGGGSTAHCNFCDMYYGRFFSAGDPDAPCRLYWSAVSGDGRTIEDWLQVSGSADASGGYVEVGDASGDAIIGICVLATKLVIFKRYSVYTLRGDRPSSYAIERVENYSERMSNASVVVKNEIPYYLTKSGIQYFDDTGIHPMNGGTRFLNSFIQTIYSVLESKGVHCKNTLYFSCKVSDASAYDDTLITFDMGRGSFMVRNGFLIADMTVHDGQVYIVNDKRYVYAFDKGRDYDGVPISAYWETQQTDLGAKYMLKKVCSVLFRAAVGTMKITVISGDAQADKTRDTFGEDGGFVVVPFSMNRSRVMKLRFDNVAGSFFSITGGVDVEIETEAKSR